MIGEGSFEKDEYTKNASIYRTNRRENYKVDNT